MSVTPATLGPYRLLESLGRGGMGIVYRAEHVETGRAVAVKTVRVPNRTHLAGIRREIHALARLEHPGITRIVEDGYERGIPWYAMELVDGRPLAETRAREGTWWTRQLALSTGAGFDTPADPLDETIDDRDTTDAGLGASQSVGVGGPLVETLTLVRRLCSALAYIHGEGLVHRDLKPANVLVRADGMPIVVDFGLTSRFRDDVSREALEVEGATAGTAAYMSPEQVLGELVDARADLYSLGCVLYLLVTGSKPFTAPTVEALMRKHLTATPLPPSAIASGVPPELDDVVLRLLEKKPERRIGHADDVAAALVRLGAEDAMPVPVPSPRAYIYRPRLCGRREELDALEQRADGIVFLGGESGVGKTRLVVELGRHASRAGALVLVGECPPETPQAALAGFRRPLREIVDLCREEGPDACERVVGRRGPVLALHEPAIATLPGQDAYPTPPELPAAAALERLFDALVGTLGALAIARRAVVILDDVQWADPLTLELLALASERRTFDETSVLVVATYRTEEVATAGRGRLRALLDRPDASVVALDRLDEAAVEAMVGEMLALAPPPRTLSRFLARQSEGNPFFVAEYLRASLGDGVLVRDGGAWRVAEGDRLAGPLADADDSGPWRAMALPRSVRELVARRLEGLDETSRQLVDAAAVLGRESDAGLLRRVARLDGVAMRGAAHDLLRRQVLEEPRPGALRFVHDKVREVAYERIASARRRALHLRSAKRLAKAGTDTAEVLAALAAHWEAGGRISEARDAALRAARLLRDRQALAQSEALYRKYVALADEPTRELVEARNELGERVLMMRGKAPEAREMHQRALDDARAIGDRRGEADALYGVALACHTLGEIDECVALCDAAVAIAREHGDDRGEGRAWKLLGLVAVQQGRYADARPIHERALELLRRAGDRATEGVTLGDYGNVLRGLGDIDGARSTIGRAVEVHRSLGTRGHEALALIALGTLDASCGRIEDALAAYEQALTAAREAGHFTPQGAALANIGVLMMWKGRLDEARTYLDEALGIQRAVGHRRFQGLTLGYIAELEHSRGNAQSARELYEQSLAIHREVKNPTHEADTLTELGRLHAEEGDLATARAHFAHALEILAPIGHPRFEALALLRLAGVERVEGRLDAAEALLDRAEPIFETLGDGLVTAECVCERGLVRLAHGLGADDQLARATALVREAAAGPDSDAARAVDQLRLAIENGTGPRSK